MADKKRKTPFVPVNLTVPARAELQQATLRMQAELGRRLSMSVILTAAMKVASEHPEDFRRYVEEPPTESIGETQ